VLRYLWQFLVTINLAYFAAFFYLKTNKLLCTTQQNAWISLLSGFVLIINLSLFVIYVREHNAIEGHVKQQKKILKRILCEYPKWYLYNGGFKEKDKFLSVTYFVIITLFLLFITIPILILSYTHNPFSAFLFVLLPLCFYFASCFKNEIEGFKNNIKCFRKIRKYFFRNKVKLIYILIVAIIIAIYILHNLPIII